jgi:predicted ATPase
LDGPIAGQVWKCCDFRQSIVLAVEDLQWVDGASALFLEVIADDVAGAPILLLGTYRPGYRPSWLDRSYANQLALAPLGRPDSLAVVRSVLPGLDADAGLAALLVDRAEGNPLFLEELAHAVEGADDVAATAVPGTIHGVLTARIDRLPESARRLLQTAAVLGREFSARVLVRLVDGVATLDADLYALGRLEFLYRRPDADEPVYVFKHALTQEVALATLVARERRVLHRRGCRGAGRRISGARRRAGAAASASLPRGGGVGGGGGSRAAGGRAARDAYANREALVRYGQALDAAERAGLGAATRAVLLENAPRTRRHLMSR